MNRLLQANVDRRESEKTQKFKETLETLKRLFPGVHGKVLELCKPTQRKYDLAVSIIMGKNMDSIVVDTEKTAIECIKYMREQRTGKATFLPLDTIVVKPTMEKYRSFVKGARLALDVIQFDNGVERAMKYVVGNALISDSMEVARTIVYERKQEVKVVTLDGTILHKTGMLTGGQGETSNHSQRWEEKEVGDLKRQRDALNLQLDDISKRKRKASHDEELVGEVVGCESRAARLKDDLSAIVQKIMSCDTELEHIVNESEGLKDDCRKASMVVRKLEDEKSDLDGKIGKVEDTVFADFCKRVKIRNIREYENTTLKATEEVAEKSLELSGVKAKIENLMQFDRQRLEDQQTRIDEIEKSLEKLNVSQVESLELKAELLEKSKGLDRIIADAQGRVDEAKIALDEKGGELLVSKQTLVDWNAQFEVVSKSIAKKVFVTLTKGIRG